MSVFALLSLLNVLDAEQVSHLTGDQLRGFINYPRIHLVFVVHVVELLFEAYDLVRMFFYSLAKFHLPFLILFVIVVVALHEKIRRNERDISLLDSLLH